MREASLFKILIENEHLITLYFVAKNQQDAYYKYAEWVKWHGANYGVDAMTDIHIKFDRTVFE